MAVTSSCRFAAGLALALLPIAAAQSDDDDGGGETSTTTIVRLVIAGLCLVVLAVASWVIARRLTRPRPVAGSVSDATGGAAQVSEVAQALHADADFVEDSIVSGARPVASVDPHGVARMLFDQHDADRNGVLDEEELWALVTELGHSLTLPDVRAAIARLDADGNGTLHFQEFLRWFDLGLSLDSLFDKEKLQEHKRNRMHSLKELHVPDTETLRTTFGMLGIDAANSGAVTHLDARQLTRAVRCLPLAASEAALLS